MKMNIENTSLKFMVLIYADMVDDNIESLCSRFDVEHTELKSYFINNNFPKKVDDICNRVIMSDIVRFDKMANQFVQRHNFYDNRVVNWNPSSMSTLNTDLG